MQLELIPSGQPVEPGCFYTLADENAPTLFPMINGVDGAFADKHRSYGVRYWRLTDTIKIQYHGSILKLDQIKALPVLRKRTRVRTKNKC